jgi:hypothetical protein
MGSGLARCDGDTRQGNGAQTGQDDGSSFKHLATSRFDDVNDPNLCREAELQISGS